MMLQQQAMMFQMAQQQLSYPTMFPQQQWQQRQRQHFQYNQYQTPRWCNSTRPAAQQNTAQPPAANRVIVIDDGETSPTPSSGNDNAKSLKETKATASHADAQVVVIQEEHVMQNPSMFTVLKPPAQENQIVKKKSTCMKTEPVVHNGQQIHTRIDARKIMQDLGSVGELNEEKKNFLEEDQLKNSRL